VNLPLDLAIAILQDSDGRIDLGLPVSGSLDDPQFSYGSIIWKAITNILGKIATAPFRAFASLFGGDAKFESIAFEAGDAKLTPPEKEKVVTLVSALKKRPRLSLSIRGVWSEADRVALQDLQLRRTVASQTGQRLAANEDPGPLSTHNAKVQAVLESLFSDRLGGGELASLKEGFRQANPGQLEQGSADKMFSRLADALRDRRTLQGQEVEDLKGADFYAILFDRLRARESISDAQRQALAQARGDHVEAILKAAGAPTDRTAMAAPGKIAGDDKDVGMKVELSTSRP
jgi:hypothetical protein